MQKPKKYVKIDQDIFFFVFFPIHLTICRYVQWDIDSNSTLKDN
jgi:hypothetical protein